MSMNYPHNISFQTDPESLDFESVRLTFSKRKSIAIYVREDGQVEIKAPNRTPQYLIKKFFAQKRSWIFRKISQQQHRQSKKIQWREDHEIHYFGHSYKIQIETSQKLSSTKKLGFKFVEDKLIIEHHQNEFPTSEKIKQQYFKWIKPETKQLMENRTKHWKNRLYPEDNEHIVIQPRLMSSRWGSCSKNHNMRLNLLLTMVPLQCFDYVIVHELCHWKFFHHGPEFYQLLESVLPQRRMLEQRLSGFDFLLLEAKK